MSSSNELNKLSPDEREMFKSMQTSARAYGMTLKIQDGEIVYVKGEQEVRREPLSALQSMLQTIVKRKRDEADSP